MIRWFTDPKIFSYIIIMGLYVLNASRWAWERSWYDVGYWVSAFGITASVTFGHK